MLHINQTVNLIFDLCTCGRFGSLPWPSVAYLANLIPLFVVLFPSLSLSGRFFMIEATKITKKTTKKREKRIHVDTLEMTVILRVEKKNQTQRNSQAVNISHKVFNEMGC